MDRYWIDDAVADGSTVPVRYTSRKADWQIEAADLDILFDNWFAELPDDKLEKLKTEGVTVSQLAKHEERIELLAKDIWEHFKSNVDPHGFKAQIVAQDVLVEVAAGRIATFVRSIERFPFMPLPVCYRRDERLAAGMRNAFVNLIDGDVREQRGVG